MLNPAYSMLDQQELLQLALGAGAANDGGSAIAYLKEAVSRSDATATAHYLLGAEYAQAGLYERAAGELEAALALDPALALARLQLGMLWLTGGVAEQARTVLTPLEEEGTDEVLRLFGGALLRLLDNQLERSAELLRAGIARNSANPPLNGDMQRILDAIEAAPGGTAASTPEPAPEGDATDDARHVLLSAYMGNARN